MRGGQGAERTILRGRIAETKLRNGRLNEGQKAAVRTIPATTERLPGDSGAVRCRLVPVRALVLGARPCSCSDGATLPAPAAIERGPGLYQPLQDGREGRQGDGHVDGDHPAQPGELAPLPGELLLQRGEIAFRGQLALPGADHAGHGLGLVPVHARAFQFAGGREGVECCRRHAAIVAALPSADHDNRAPADRLPGRNLTPARHSRYAKVVMDEILRQRELAACGPARRRSPTHR